MGPEARQLPDTLTELIEHALASASTLDRNRYTPHQAAYLTHRGKDRPALVGAAGMLIAGDLRLSAHEDWRAELDTETWNKVFAVDATEYALFDDALSLTHRLGLKKMPEAELLQSKVNHAVMTAIGRAMSRHGNVFQALRQAVSGPRYTDWAGWQQSADRLRAAIPAVREMETSLADASVLDERSTAAVERLAARDAG